MARTVEDLELGLDLLAGPDDWHAPGYRLELPPPRHGNISDYRVAAWFEEPSCPIDDRVRERLEAAADALESAGATVDREARPDFTFDYATRVFGQLLGAAMCGGFSHQEIEELAERGLREEEEGALAARWASQRHRAWLSANERRLQMRRKWHEFFREWDAVLLPCLPTTAIPHDHGEPMGRAAHHRQRRTASLRGTDPLGRPHRSRLLAGDRDPGRRRLGRPAGRTPDRGTLPRGSHYAGPRPT